MRIVHFDQMFHPEFGDQINILPKYQVMQGHEVFIITGKSNVPHPRFLNFADLTEMDQKDKKFEIETGVKIIRVDIKKFISGRAIYKKGYFDLVNNLNPDILFCHFNDTVLGMHYTWLSKKLSYPVIFDTHMLEMASINPLNKAFRFFYRLFLAPIINRRKLIVIRTQDDNYVNTKLGISQKLTPFISFGSDTTLFYPDSKTRINFRKEHNISDDDFVVIYTGKLTAGKGGKLLAQAFKEKFPTNKNIVLVVVGKAYGDYGREVEELLSESSNRIIRFPTQKYKDLPKFYKMADLSVFPKQCSLSFYDAQACGLPVIAENNNINQERLKHNNGYVYKIEDINDFRNKIVKMAELSKQEYQKLSKNSYEFIINNYNYEDIAEQYTEVMYNQYKKFKLKRGI